MVNPLSPGGLMQKLFKMLPVGNGQKMLTVLENNTVAILIVYVVLFG